MCSLQEHIERDIRARALRVVEVRRPVGYQYGSAGVIYYGQALTGMPIITAKVIDPPRNEAERDWLDNYLPTFIAPAGNVEREAVDSSQSAGKD